jgi:putative regulator of septum formation
VAERTAIRVLARALCLGCAVAILLTTWSVEIADRAGATGQGGSTKHTTTTVGNGTTSTTREHVDLSQVGRGDCADIAGSDPMSRWVTVVPCRAPHELEYVGPVSLVKAPRRYPGVDQLGKLAQPLCLARDVKYLGAPLDPFGRFLSEEFVPTRKGWKAGEREISCTLAWRPDSVPTAADGLTKFTGRVKGQDQTPRLATGTCIAFAEESHSLGVVDCHVVHEYEITGSSDVTGKATTLPTHDQFGALTSDDCTRAGLAYFGGRLPAGVATGWFDIQDLSWTAGRRLVDCIAARPDGAGGWGSITGPLRG